MKYTLSILFYFIISSLFGQSDSLIICSYSIDKIFSNDNKIDENELNKDLDSIFNLIKLDIIHVHQDVSVDNCFALQQLNPQTFQKFEDFPDAKSTSVGIETWHYLSVYNSLERKEQALSYDGLSDSITVRHDGLVRLVVNHDYFSRPIQLSDIDSVIFLFDENHNPTFISFVLSNTYFNLPRVFIPFNDFQDFVIINKWFTEIILSKKQVSSKKFVICSKKHYSLSTNEFWFDLVIIGNAFYELNKMSTWFHSGYGMWESGKAIIEGNSMTLLSDNPQDPTSTIRFDIVLSNDEEDTDEFYFISESEDEFWKIIGVGNEVFKERILQKSNR